MIARQRIAPGRPMPMTKQQPLKAPFPWFGGKSRVANLIWKRFGNVPNYCEPFFGSGAVLLGRPHIPKIETINDLDCMVANFWRAVKYDPEKVAHYADWPVNEADKQARHLWLIKQEKFREHIKSDPDYYDAKIAGWWVWGQCIWIGSGWCAAQLSDNAAGQVSRQIPHLSSAGQGIHRQRPHLTSRQGVHRPEHSGENLIAYIQNLANRLRYVRVCCGNWDRILGETPTLCLG